jgi:iron complex transport system substrate-binding protein
MTRTRSLVLTATLSALAFGGCSAVADTRGASDDVTVTNCEKEVSFPSPARRLFVNDSNLISMVLALGAEDQVAAVSSMNRDQNVLTEHYGSAVGDLNQVSDDYPSLETVIAQRPDVMVAGYGYGYDDAKHLTPDSLATHGIGAYVLTESCRQDDSAARGIVDPWTALRDDLTNLGQITGHTEQAMKVIAELDARIQALRNLPQPKKKPVLFVFDSGDNAIFTSGALGAPQAIIETTGGRNAVEDLRDTWTEVSWERLAAAQPDAFLFVDYPGQSFEQKVAILKAHPATRNLPAVKQERFLDLPYVMWTSGPLNIVAAEDVRAALEKWRLVPTR